MKTITVFTIIFEYEEIIEEIKELSRELKNFDSALIHKVKWLALNKIDLVDQEELETLRHELENQFKEDLFIYCISAAKKNGTQKLMRDSGKFMES